MPANRLPIITACAPAASAFTTSPLYLTPPSAITGTSVPSTARAASSTAVICAMPAPVTTRVVQIAPGPMPTFTASAPASTTARAPSKVPTFPTTSWASGNLPRSVRAASSTPFEWAWALSTTSASAPAASSAAPRSR